MRAPRANDLIESELTTRNRDLGGLFGSDVIIIKAPLRFGLDDLIRQEIEGLHRNPADRLPCLTVLVETTGGYIEVVERIYNIFRKHYDRVNFIVPNYAYSAGTVLVLSGDEIFMDYYSVLGPIDPQVEDDSDNFVPGLGYLQKFSEFCDRINSAANADSVRAELAYILKKFDPARLFFLEQAKKHSESLLENWLSRHKFKDWTIRETTGHPVTEEDRKARAKEIAEILGNPSRWHSHGRGIGIRELISEEIKLKVVDFGANPSMNARIRSYYDLFMDFCGKLGATSPNHTVLHTPNGVQRQ